VSGAKEIAGDTGRPANGQFGGMRAPNCDKPASTRTNWANEAKEIAAGIARPAEGACKGRCLSVLQSDPPSLGIAPVPQSAAFSEAPGNQEAGAS
jgi:hypothetical protein